MFMLKSTHNQKMNAAVLKNAEEQEALMRNIEGMHNMAYMIHNNVKLIEDVLSNTNRGILTKVSKEQLNQLLAEIKLSAMAIDPTISEG